MKKEEFTPKDVLEIFKLYKKHLGGDFVDKFIGNQYRRLEYIAKEINKEGTIEDTRFDSRYNAHVKFSFITDPETKDIVPYVKLRNEKAKGDLNNFMKEVREYFSSQQFL
ncbi:hypothetical protein HOD29_03765 [archaeon]|jgi:hypothetical protein|nr:hypothetical protein [archaeon]